MWIASLNQMQAVPKADASGEREAVPKVTGLIIGESTIPIVTNHCKAVTISGESTGAGSVEVEHRAVEGGNWTLLTTLTFAGAETQSERLECPIGHLRAVVAGAATITVFVQGLVNN